MTESANSQVRLCACGKPVKARGMCQGCYKRWKRANDPDYAQRDRESSVRWKDRNRDAKRAQDRQHYQDIKVPCPQCGTGMMKPDAERCRGCYNIARSEHRALVERMWAEGKSMREIGEALGYKSGVFQPGPYRKHGWDLPHRYRVAA